MDYLNYTTSHADLLGEMLYPFIASIIAGFLWLKVCRLIFRKEDLIHAEKLASSDLVSKYFLAAKGSPSDRFFLGTLMTVSIFGAFYVFLKVFVHI